jgi:hypothetical protein
MKSFFAVTQAANRSRDGNGPGALPAFVFLLLCSCLILGAGCGGTSGPGGDPCPAGSGVCAGFASQDITPYKGLVKMAGYGVFFLDERNCRWSAGIHDPLYAHALALEDPGRGSAVVLVVLDLIGMMAADAGKIRSGVSAALGIDEGAVIVSCTHTHHGPDTIGLYGTVLPPRTGRQEEAVQGAVRGAVRACIRAWQTREPAVLRIATGEEAGLHENRVYADPDRVIDHTTTLLSAYAERGSRLLGTLLNWACHPTVMGEKNRLLSSDFAGAYYREMIRSLGGIHLFVNGAIGASIEPVERFLDPDRWDEVERFGQVLARDARELLERAVLLPDPSLDAPLTRPVPVSLENPFLRFALESGLIPREIPAPGEDGETLVTAFALGPVLFGTLPGEFVPDYSLRLRRLLAGDAQVIVGLGQDWLGSAGTPEQYRKTAYGYERLLSPGSGIGERVMEVYGRILDNSM